MVPPVLVIDLDGTLADTRKDLLAVLNSVTASHGLTPLDEETLGAVAGRGARAMIDLAFATNGQPLTNADRERLFIQFLAEYESNPAVETVLYDGALSALDECAARGWQLAICTNKLEYLAQKVIDGLGISNRFYTITGSDTYDEKKPHPLPLLKTVELAGGHPENAVMLGDTMTDVKAAKAANMTSIAVAFGYSEVAVETLGANHTINDYKQLPELLAGL